MAEPTKNTGRGATNNAVFIIFGIIAIAALAIVVIIYKPNFPKLNVGGGSESNSGYVLLFKNMELTDAAAVVESLKAQGVKDYKIEDDGRTVLVPRKKRNDVILSIAKEGIMPTGGTVGFEIFDKGAALGATDFDKQIKFSRAISGELARSISRIYGVEECRVQVVIPAKQLFSTVKNPVQSAVFVKVREGELLSPLQVFGIVALVSSSVEDLRTANVTVIDYYGRVLSAPVYAKDYERLLVMVNSQKEEANRNAKRTMSTSAGMENTGSYAATPQPGKATKSGRGFFEIYRKTDSNELSKMVGVKGKGSTSDVLDAKLRFKDKYEKLLEKNVKEILTQFFPKNSFIVKINIEVSNLMTADDNLDTLISRITSLILLDENNPDVRITPENKEVVIKAVASSIGYVRGRDRIELRLSPLTQEKVLTTEVAEANTGLRSQRTAAPTVSPVVSGNKKSLPISFAKYRPKDITIDWTFVYYGAGGLGVLLVILMVLRKRKPVVAEPAEDARSIFDEADKKETDGFDDVSAVPSVDQMRDLVAQSPEKVAAVLEQWLKEDEVK